MITLDVQCPDHLRTVFDERPFLKVDNDLGNVARDTLLMWLVGSKSGVWVSEHPNEAKLALQERFVMFPHLKFDHITFTKPNEITRVTYQFCVNESDDFDVAVLNVMQTRQLKNVNRAVAIDSLGMSLEERLVLLDEVRQGSNVQYDEDELIASVTRESYFQFVKEFWGQIIAETPVWNWHIPFICSELQTVAERVYKGQPKDYDLIINVPPGTSKSTTCSIMFSPWTWTRMPAARTLCGSYAGQLATDLARKNRDVVLSDKFRRVFPEVKLAADQSAKSHFVNTKGGSRYSFGMQGTVTGMHAHFIMIDDPLNPEKAVSEVELNKANRVMSETLFTRKVDKDLTPTILIMQRLHQNDPTTHMMDTYENVKWICLPAEDSDKVRPAVLREKYIDGLLDPVRLSKKTLDSNRKALGTFSYAGQFDQTPVPRGGAMFKPGRIIVDHRPKAINFERRIRYWDKAGTQDAGCYTAGVEMGIHRNGTIWVLDVVRGQWAMDEREATIKQTAELDGHDVTVWIEQEPGSGGKDQALYTVKNLAGFRIKVDPVGSGSGNKIVRAGPFADQVNSGNVKMAKANWNKAYVDELTYFPASKYKDQVDASSGAFNQLFKKPLRAGGIR